MAQAFIGIDLGGTKCHGAVVDKAGEVLAEVRQPTWDAGARLAISTVWDSLAETAKLEGLVVAQTVLGVPAVVDRRMGTLSRGPNVGWGSLGADELLVGRGPVRVYNDANLAAFAELTVGSMTETPDFVLFSLGTGFGGAVVTEGRVVEGHRGGAAEFGDMRLGFATGERGVSGTRLEDSVSGLGIEESAKRLSAAIAPSELRFRLSAEGVVSAALAGDTAARLILDPVLKTLARLVITVGYVLDPAAVVFDGSVGRALAPFLAEVRSLAAPHLDDVPTLTASELQPNSTVVGALAMARSVIDPAHRWALKREDEL